MQGAVPWLGLSSIPHRIESYVRGLPDVARPFGCQDRLLTDKLASRSHSRTEPEGLCNSSSQDATSRMRSSREFS